MANSMTMYVYDSKYYKENQVGWPGTSYYRLFYPSFDLDLDLDLDLDGQELHTTVFSIPLSPMSR